MSLFIEVGSMGRRLKVLVNINLNVSPNLIKVHV